MNLDLIAVETPPGVNAWFTTRVGGVSTGNWAGLNIGVSSGDDPEAVRENRRRLCELTAVSATRVTMGAQVHGTQIHMIGDPPRPGDFTAAAMDWDQGDGLVTSRSDLPLVVLGADCLPVLMWRSDGAAVGAAHAGWRGLVDGILENLVVALGDPHELGAAIGPGVGPCCYPVDQDLRTRFAARFGADTVHGDAVHLAGAAIRDLVALGIPTESVAVVDACTSCEPDRFFSYRRDGARTGRQAGMIVKVAA